MKHTRVAILGAGQIGRAVYKILTELSVNYRYSKELPYSNIDAFVIDSNEESIRSLIYGSHLLVDFSSATVDEISEILLNQEVTHVINALPFNLNEKVASAALFARCSYIDFTEDDVMADKVQQLYKDSTLNCAVKCGLAPGFINYVGRNLIDELDIPESLMIGVGALPATVCYDANRPELSYNLSWSVDGLVNEYIRPCRIRKDGIETEVEPLTGISKVILDGLEYEAAYTSGGVGSLVKELKNVPNVCYKTLRYPGHYRYVKKIVTEKKKDFDSIKKVFQKKFPTTTDDVIVVYAETTGYLNNTLTRRTYFNKFYGVNGLTGIQSTTAGSGVAMLELMASGLVSGIINHQDVMLEDFCKTVAFKEYYSIAK